LRIAEGPREARANAVDARAVAVTARAEVSQCQVGQCVVGIEGDAFFIGRRRFLEPADEFQEVAVQVTHPIAPQALRARGIQESQCLRVLLEQAALLREFGQHARCREPRRVELREPPGTCP